MRLLHARHCHGQLEVETRGCADAEGYTYADAMLMLRYSAISSAPLQTPAGGPGDRKGMAAAHIAGPPPI